MATNQMPTAEEVLAELNEQEQAEQAAVKKEVLKIIAKAKDRVTAAKVQLLLDFAFWGSLACRCPIQVAMDPRVPTAATDGKAIFFNAQFVESLDNDELKFVLAHEIGHMAFLHPERLHGRDPKKWNCAGDFVINLMLHDCGLRRPEGCLFDEQYGGANADQVYLALEDEEKNEEPDHGGDLHAPGSLSGGGAPDQASAKQHEADMKTTVAQAMNAAKEASRRSGDRTYEAMRRLVDDLLTGKLDWKVILRQFCTETAKDDYTWTRPNRRFIDQNVYLPSMHSEAMGKLAICIDTSGSIDNEMLKEFCGEVNKLIVDCKPKEVYINYCDTQVRNRQHLEEGEEWVPEVAGGGGTMFSPAIADVVDNFEPSAIIYLTDMWCNDFGADPGVPVLWMDWEGSSSSKPPFGQVISYEPECRQ